MLNFGLGVATNPAISELQQALLALARASGDARLNPGVISGTLDDATMIALSIGLGIAIRKTADRSIPSEIVTLLQYTAMTDWAKQRTTEYATTISRVLRSAVIAYTTGTLDPNKPPTNTTPSNLPQVDLSTLPIDLRKLPRLPRASGGAPTQPAASAPKWYATWWGIGGLIILGGLAIMAFDRNPQA
jgi:hypothetical protein